MFRAPGRGRTLAALATGAFLLGWAAPVGATSGAGASTTGRDEISAYLDGKPIKASQVANWYCEDFAYPVINCFSDPAQLESRAGSFLAAATGDYVVIYDYTGYAGSYMYVSQDYTVLALIGWSDRISSLRSINSGQGHFFVDWFYGGNAYYFCCNTQYPSLGVYDNALSSVHRL
jgi:hypothetical protein